MLKLPITILIAFLCLYQALHCDAKVDLIEEAKQSVVWIHAFGMPTIGAEAGYGTGSGYVIGEGGLIITNEHVIRNASGIVVFAQNSSSREKYFATVLYADSSLDLAVLQAMHCRLPALPLEEEHEIRQGDEVLILGYPGSTFRPGNMNVSWGIISSATGDSTLQTTAAINSGNSGGPAINLDGNCVGTVYAKIVGLNVEGAGFIRNIRYAHDLLSKTRHLVANEFFGTRNFEAYKKICEAAMIAWDAETEENVYRQQALIEQSKQLVLDAIDLDPNFAEAHRILGGYFLKEAILDCLGGDEVTAERKVKQFFYEINKAESIKPSLRYKEDFTTLMKWIIEEESLDCSSWQSMISEMERLRSERDERMAEFQEYILTGKTPEKLKASIVYDPYSRINESRYYDRSSRTRTRYRSLIPGVPVTIKFKAPVRGKTLFDEGEYDPPVTNLEFQCEILDDIRPIVGLNFNAYNGADNMIVNLGLNMSNFTFMIASFKSINPFIHLWSLDCTTNLPGKGRGDDMNAIWSFGLGQISIPRLSADSPEFRLERDKVVTFRMAFEFRLVHRTWIDMELISPISKPDFPNVFDEYYQLVFGVGLRL